MEINSINEINVLNLFRKKLFARLSISTITKELHSKSYQRIYEAVENLVKKDILHSEKIGNSNIISLKFSRMAILSLAYADEKEAFRIPNYSKILDIKEISDFLILVTGSYASGKFTKKSDLDLVIIVPDKENVVSIQKKVENLTMLFVPQVHLYVFTKKDFVEMLKDKKDNYGKEIVKNKILLKNAQMFYELLKEAIENGYKG